MKNAQGDVNLAQAIEKCLKLRKETLNRVRWSMLIIQSSDDLLVNFSCPIYCISALTALKKCITLLRPTLSIPERCIQLE